MKKRIKIILMVGLPASGKSTYINETLNGSEANYIISDDDITNEIAKELNLTYNDMFAIPSDNMKIGEIHNKYGEVIKTPDVKNPFFNFGKKSYKKIFYGKMEELHRLNKKFKESLNQDKPIIIDMPNLTVKKREMVLKEIFKYKSSEHEFFVEFIEFKYGDISILQKIADLRHKKISSQGGSKIISKEVYKYMDSIYTPVNINEKYVNEITSVDNQQTLIRILIKEEQIQNNKKLGYYDNIKSNKTNISKLNK